MRKKLGVRSAVAAAFLAASCASNVAFAIGEVEPNDSITAAYGLPAGDGGTIEVTGVIGVESPEADATTDVDFFSFHGNEGDVVTLDIDGGMKPWSTTERSLDSYIAIFGPGLAGPLTKLLESDDAFPADEGSAMSEDARIENFALPKTGTYWVGVSSRPRWFADGGFVTSEFLEFTSNGRYTLLISWAPPTTPEMDHVNIEIKPGTKEVSFINPKAKGSIPVALLSSEKFKPLEVDQESLTFGAKGSEESRIRCNKNGADLNHDGIPDLLCHFDSQIAGFEPGDTAGHIKGKKNDGKPFEGQGNLKAVIEKRKKR
jgi:hypothetical protein